MSFKVKDNNIQVTATNGDIVFDTSTPMPHITDVITNTITHSFPDASDTNSKSGFSIINDFSCSYTYYQYVTNYSSYSCSGTSFSSDCCDFGCFGSCFGNYEYVCSSSFFGGYSCGFELTGYDCSCYCSYSSFESVTEYEDSYYSWANNVVSASSNSSTYTIGTVANDTNPDFILVLANISRTAAGSTYDLGTFICTVHQGNNTIANGSTVLETAFDYNGNEWLGRIIDVYISGNDIKADFKHSNSDYTNKISFYSFECGWPATGAYADTDNIASSFSVAFTVYVGKFTQ